MATISELITLAQNNLETVLNADPSKYVDYRIGDKSVNKSQYVQFLFDTIERLTKISNESPEADFDFAALDFNISQSGEDLSEYDT
jgi:hypothetical protein